MSVDRRAVALAMAAEAATLVAAATLHFARATGEGTKPFRPEGAAVAETVIAVVLVVGAAALARGSRGAGVAAIAFAIVGFLVGLDFTIRGGSAGDLAYHAAMLPLLLLTLVTLLSRGLAPSRLVHSARRARRP
jgi:hypothetical protein